jgi:hypothetical protein
VEKKPVFVEKKIGGDKNGGTRWTNKKFDKYQIPVRFPSQKSRFMDEAVFVGW